MTAAAVDSLVLPPPRPPAAVELEPAQRNAMLEAADVIAESQRVLGKAGLNIVGEVLKGQGPFYELEHYPAQDVIDTDSHAQYYYHAHRAAQGEHGHFHCFLRTPGIPQALRALHRPQAQGSEAAEGEDATCHLIAISMDSWGLPIALFACNRWVTGETWYPASAVELMLDRFVIDHAHPSWPVNLWLGAMFRLFRSHISALLFHRDEVVRAWQRAYPDVDVLEERDLEITGQLSISIVDWVRELEWAQD